MSAAPPSKPSRAARVITSAVLIAPFALVGVGVGLVLGVGWGMTAAGLLIWRDTHAVGAPRDGKP